MKRENYLVKIHSYFLVEGKFYSHGMLNQRRLERKETNLMHFKWEET